MSSTRIKGRQHQEQDDEYDSGSEEENPRWGGFAFMMDDSSSSSDDDDRDKDVEHDSCSRSYQMDWSVVLGDLEDGMTTGKYQYQTRTAGGDKVVLIVLERNHTL